MELSYKKLCGYERKLKSGLGYEAYSYIYVWGETKDLKKLINYIDNNFILYKDNMKFGQHEIHIWGNREDTRYLLMTLNEDKLKEVGCKNFYEELKKELETNFNNTNISVEFGLDYMLDAIKIENFIDKFVIDLNNLPFEKLSIIEPCYTSFPKLKESYVKRYYDIEKTILKQLLNKTIVVNGIKGKFKKVNNSVTGYGFFKQRARNKYYNFTLNKINSLEFC